MLLDTRHNAVTKEIIGGAMRVHSALGSGFPENIYHRSLSLEMTRAGLAFESEVHLPVFYLETQVGARRVDFLVDDCVLVEIKALTELNPLNHAQIINYLNAYRLEVGLLINFGEASLCFKRFVRSHSR
ncbi:GxxExxY protein [Hymenobacter coccineus]|uniref:GxxExxY protein n=1 Tax=Hymenobacter coccineus TaxID=1908235 RepID=A0A1G1TIG0_9BACT|nr:GxxExxY protein [Hymenobacter coccineus]OGX90653.1 GxxExxY protein [Hymenobacter coccineus]